MNARIGHVTDGCDSRPIFEIVYRRYSEPKSRCFRVQADDSQSAKRALDKHIGNAWYVILSISNG